MFLPTTSAKVLRRQKYLSERLGRRVVREKLDAVAKGLEICIVAFVSVLSVHRVFRDSNFTLNPEDGTRKLSEADVVAQTSLVVIAGQETTANTLSFALLELARSPDVQNTLGLEIRSILGAGVVGSIERRVCPQETLRLYPAIPLSDRIALEDTTIPFSQPITTATGERMSQVPVMKGQIVTIAVASYQR
ncbi:cytochrome P450 [Mycena vitilis]|nr:cytochrome P450 [Mycena vitilis]